MHLVTLYKWYYALEAPIVHIVTLVIMFSGAVSSELKNLQTTSNEET